MVAVVVAIVYTSQNFSWTRPNMWVWWSPNRTPNIRHFNCNKIFKKIIAQRFLCILVPMALVFAIRNSVQKFRFNCSIHFWIILHRKWIESKVYRFRIFYQEYVLLLVDFLQQSVRHSGSFLKKLIELFKQLIVEELFEKLLKDGVL